MIQPLMHPATAAQNTLSSSAFAIHSLHAGARSWLNAEARNEASSNLLSSNHLFTSSIDEDTTNNQLLQLLSTIKPQKDTVKRIIDSSTIQLTNLGYVTLDTVRGAGSTYSLPECMDKAPSYKLKGLLSKGTEVKVYDLSKNGSDATNRVWIVRSQDDLVINRELVRTGYAFVRKGAYTNDNFAEIINNFNELEQIARREGFGIFKICTDGTSSNIASTKDENSDARTEVTNSNFVAEFEPLEYTTQTQWGDDGGKTILVPKPSSSIPSNPGDIKGCSDFATYEDALGWYETYKPYYGDVAKLDRDGDGVPCPGLPHTRRMERYRMKRPAVVDGGSLNK